MTKEEYETIPIEERPMFIAMVNRDGHWVMHHACTKGVFASEKGLVAALGDEPNLVFKLEYTGSTFVPFSKEIPNE